MSTLSLKIYLVDRNVTKTMQFDPCTSVYESCKIIRDKIAEANYGEVKDYGLFLSHGDTKNGIWLEPGRNLEYYNLKNGEEVEYRHKMRTLKVLLLDGTLKTLLVDDSQPVANMMVVICSKIGIANYDEYGLVRENPEEDLEIKPNFGTLTLRWKKDEKEKDQKMELLRKKLKTDDEINWIDVSKTFLEQGIDESEPVLLRRKYFFSDGNIDRYDPVQLNLLYVQARDAVLDGIHPVTQELACQLAGIQTHIQFGDYNPTKHPLFDVRDFLPKSYIKVKGIEKKILSEQQSHIGLSELDAKVLYTKTCRSLPTYGVTFFLVKEKMKGKNKLVPRLLGVTKDSVLRLDEHTKEIIKTWPLTTVKRWGASSNVFTLDFGDYSDQYYSVQTTEAEQIQQLIAGYIDIILIKKLSKDHFGIEGNDGCTMIEDSVSPLRATIFQNEFNRVVNKNTKSVVEPEIFQSGNDGARPYGVGHVGSAQYTSVSEQINIAHSPTTTQQSHVSNILSGSQKALLSTITEGYEVITTVEKELISKVIIPDLGNDTAMLKWKETTIDDNKNQVGSQIAAINAATAQVVTMTSEECTDYSGVDSAIMTISQTLPIICRGVRMLAALTPDGEKILVAAKNLCLAFGDLLKAAQPISNQSQQNLLNAATCLGEASSYILTEIGKFHTHEREDYLLSLAKSVANTMAALVLKAKSVASTLHPNHQTTVITSATKCALATSQLVACTKVVAPTVEDPACQQQLITAVNEVANTVESLVTLCNHTCTDENLNKDLLIAAAEVTKTLNHIKSTLDPTQAMENTVEVMMSSSDQLLTSNGDASEMVRQAQILGQETAHLIQAIKGDAEIEADLVLQRRLLIAAKHLAEATAQMVEAARQCASAPLDILKQEALVNTVEELRKAVTPTLRYKLFKESQSNQFQSFLPEEQDVEEIIFEEQEIIECNEEIYSNDFPHSSKQSSRLQQELSSADVEHSNHIISIY